MSGEKNVHPDRHVAGLSPARVPPAAEVRRGASVRLVSAGLLALTVCCAREPESQTPSAPLPTPAATAPVGGPLPGPTRTGEAHADTFAVPPPVKPLKTLAPARTIAPPTATPAPVNAEEARELLEQEGVDPDELSRQLGEQMRQRFKSSPGR
jgi:hypothetical protein